MLQYLTSNLVKVYLSDNRYRVHELHSGNYLLASKSHSYPVNYCVSPEIMLDDFGSPVNWIFPVEVPKAKAIEFKKAFRENKLVLSGLIERIQIFPAIANEVLGGITFDCNSPTNMFSFPDQTAKNFFALFTVKWKTDDDGREFRLNYHPTKNRHYSVEHGRGNTSKYAARKGALFFDSERQSPQRGVDTWVLPASQIPAPLICWYGEKWNQNIQNFS